MAWNPGQQLFGDRYIIERKLGEGGIGITYLAKNRRGELRVIKTLREQILNHPAWISKQDKLRQDFRDEALRLALCRHSHIVQVENVFDEDNLPCMAMEYIEGEDLGKQITEKRALLEAEALLYIRQIGDALTVVHERGLLHRDLKPSNIMMRAGKQEAVLIDFGIARQFIPGAVQLHTENLTPGYAPPEQYVPDAERGEYIDVYALAATLYSLLTGQLPMAAPVRLQNFTMRSPKELNSRVSDRVNEAIMQGMALNYKFRPQSVQEWLDLLSAGIVVPTQPVISSSNTSPSATILTRQSVISPPYTPLYWECVHIIPGVSGEIGVSPKGDILVSAAASVIHLFSSTTGQLIRTLTGHYGWVNCLTFSNDGQIIASCSCYQGEIGDISRYMIKLWDVATGREICTLIHSEEPHHSGFIARPISYSRGGTCLAFSNDGQILASGISYSSTIKLWEVGTGREIRTLSQDVFFGDSLAFSSDGQILASGSNDNTIKLWEVATGREIRTLTGYFKPVNCLAFSSNRRIIVSSSTDNTIKVCELATNPNWLQKIIIGIKIRTLRDHSKSVNFLALSNNGQILASASNDKTIKVWEVRTGREIRTLRGHSQSLNSLALSNDGQILASASNDKTIKLWKVTAGREIYTFTGHSEQVHCLAFSNNGQILASGSNDNTIKVWEVATGKEIRTLTAYNFLVISIALSKDGQILASGSWGNTIKLWEVATGREICTLREHSEEAKYVALSNDGQILASNSRDNTSMWEVATGTKIRTLCSHSNGGRSVAFSNDGQILASASNDKTIKLWEVATGREIRSLRGHSESLDSLAFSNDGQILASSSWSTEDWYNNPIKTIKLWEVATGREILTLPVYSWSRVSFAFNADGQILASGNENKTIKVWEMQTGKEICNLDHFDNVSSVAFSPNGSCLAAGDVSGNIKIWQHS
ncbi:MAG: protein kinase domain-containing protein [Nostoc sp. EkiNYC01]|nr:protein kinase [Nostoc sp. EkiNYC01]